MRISDWSSDVCSSDLVSASGTAAYERQSTLSFRVGGVISRLTVDMGSRIRVGQPLARIAGTDIQQQLASRDAELARATRTLARLEALAQSGSVASAAVPDQRDTVEQRSEEHRSDLQQLMRI